MARVGPLAGKDIDALWAALRPRILGLGIGGLVGPQGPAGPKGVVWRGAWAADTDYDEGDIVTHDSAGGETLTFFCLTAHTSWAAAEPTVGGDTYWHEINPGYLIIDGTRAMTGDLNMASHEVDNATILHLVGDDSSGTARIDGAERIVFNDEPTKSVIELPSRIELNPDVEAGVDYAAAEAITSWDTLEDDLIANVASGSTFFGIALGWDVVLAYDDAAPV